MSVGAPLANNYRAPYGIETTIDSASTVSVLAKLSGRGTLPRNARIISRFADIVAVELPRQDLVAFRNSEAIENIERPRPLRASRAVETHLSDATITHNTRRPAGVKATGRGSIVAVLDWGIDFASPSLVTVNPDDGAPRTRLLGIFDQRGNDTAANRWGYGRIITPEQINRALLADDPYHALGYHPGTSDSRDKRSGRWQGSHGTHVMDIAAGNGNGSGPMGVAPQADLLFCHLSRTHPVIGTQGTLGSSANILHGIDWCFEMAGDRPIVINASLGAHNGPHDGSSYAELGIDRALELAPGRVMVNSAGNYFRKAAHASGRVQAGTVETLRVFVPPNDPTPSELELWHAPVDQFTFHLRPPNATRGIPIRFGESGVLRMDGKVLGRYSYDTRNNGDAALWILFVRDAVDGIWSLSIAPDHVADGRYHAWIERDSGLQPRFIGEAVDQNYTTGTICNGANTITVGAIDGQTTSPELGRFSSSGPTRDGRVKPEIVAPGVRIVAAQSTPPGGSPAPRLVAKSGTSMAAPHVTGTIALMQECLGETIPIDEMRKLLFSSLSKPNLQVADNRSIHRLGYGVLDIAAAEKAARAWRQKHTIKEVETMDTYHDISPDKEAAEDFQADTEIELAPFEQEHTGYTEWQDTTGDFADDEPDQTSTVELWPWDAEIEDSSPKTTYRVQQNKADVAMSFDSNALDVSHDIPRDDLIAAAEAVLMQRHATREQSDHFSEQADPFCQRREAIARIARQEFQEWRGRSERDAGRLPALIRYWSAAGRSPDQAQETARRSAANEVPWSAAFICYVMRQAGITRRDGFLFSGAHIRYIVGALRNRERSDQNQPFWLLDSTELVNEVRLQPGDLLCLNRPATHRGRNIMTNHSYDSLRQQYWDGENRTINPVSAANQRARVTSSHTSLVVGTAQRNGVPIVQCIGGNEGQSVRLRSYPINSGGGIDNPAAHRIFGAIKMMRC